LQKKEGERMQKSWTGLETQPAVWLTTLRQDRFFKIRKKKELSWFSNVLCA
jgi:hypothetical protein